MYFSGFLPFSTNGLTDGNANLRTTVEQRSGRVESLRVKASFSQYIMKNEFPACAFDKSQTKTPTKL